VKVETLLKEGRTRLQAQGTFSVALDVRLLLQAATGLSHAEIIAEPEREVDEATVSRFQDFIARRVAHEPVSRIRGHREFYGRDFIVTPDVLDPRADTEVVVELALKHINGGRFIDLGTGSGAIAVTLCAENQNLSGIASDVSPSALLVAEANAKANGVADRIRFLHGSWFDGLSEKFDLIVSNPPYVRLDEKLMPDVSDYDPHLALFAGADGMESYRAISAGTAFHLATGGLVVVEIGAGQSEEVARLFETSGLELLEMAEDLQGHKRAMAFRQAKY